MKKYLIILIPFLIGVGCFVTYSIIGSHVAENGLLVEPFFLIPIGYLFLLISIILGLILAVHYLFKKYLFKK